MKTYLHLAHGFLGRTTDWEPILDHELLSSKNIAIHNIDLYSLVNPKIVEEKLKSFQLNLDPRDRHFFVGYSMGSRLIFEFLQRNPDLKFWRFLNFSGAWGQNPEQSFGDRRRWDQNWAEKFRDFKTPWAELLELWSKYEVFGGHSFLRPEAKADREKLALMIEHWSPVWQSDARSFLIKNEERITTVLGETDQKYQNLYHEFPHINIKDSGHRVLWQGTKNCRRILNEYIDSEVL